MFLDKIIQHRPERIRELGLLSRLLSRLALLLIL